MIALILIIDLFFIFQFILDYKKMEEKQKMLNDLCETNMIKSKKEHIEKQTEELFGYFTEDYRYQDPMMLVGRRYKDKEKEFQTTKKENQELKMRTRNLAEELSFLKNSLKDGQMREYLRESASQDLHVKDSLNVTKMFNLTEDTDITEIQKQMADIGKMKEEAFKEDKLLTEEFKLRLELFIDQLQKEHKLQMMKNYSVSQKKIENQEMITIPKNRYYVLMEIYSINVAQNGIRQLQKRFQSEKNKQKLEEIQKNKEKFYETYANFAENQNFDVKDLHQLFKTLARKVGFQKLWDRYHTQNLQESIILKNSIDIILANSIKPNLQQQKKDLKPQGHHFISKLNDIVNIVQFSQRQKDYWKQLYDKINTNNLLNVQKTIQAVRKEEENVKAVLVANLSDVIALSLRQSVQSFDYFMSTKFNKKIPENKALLKEISKESVKTCLDRDLNPQEWNICLENVEKVLKKKHQFIKNYQKKHFVFISTNQIYRNLGKIK